MGCSKSGGSSGAISPAARSVGRSTLAAAPATASLTASLGGDVMIFNGLPDDKPVEAWGLDLVESARPGMDDRRTLGSLGGLPFVTIYNKDRGVAFFNTSRVQEPFTVRLTADANQTTVEVSGGSSIERFEYSKGDYFDALREFAERMNAKGMSAKPAPSWAFDPIWETYGYEEDFSPDTIRQALPYLRQLGVKTITIDSGWYGSGRGDNADFGTGDFNVNPDIIGDVNGDGQVNDADFAAFVDELHREGFTVRIWWVAGVAERGTQLFADHSDWFYSDARSSTNDTADVYLDPTLPAVRSWNRELVRRFLRFGVDGFKIDDIYQIAIKAADQARAAELQLAYAELIEDVYREVELSGRGGDFAINICNCGVAQNLYQFNGENQLITSDPLSARQVRLRGKAYQAMNLNGSAILGDHIELSAGNDPGSAELLQQRFYDTVDFASVVALGMVLETKARFDQPPFQLGSTNDLYPTWFRIYREKTFHEMEWVNLPYHGGMETYLLRDGDRYYFSFFTAQPNARFSGQVALPKLPSGAQCTASELVSGNRLDSFAAGATAHQLTVDFEGSLVVEVVCIP